MYVAQQAGYYRNHGLNVTIRAANHPAGVAMLVSGEAHVNVLPLERAIAVACKDHEFVVSAAPVRKWLFAMVARPEIQSMRAMRGKKVGIAQLGDATYFTSLGLLRKFDLTPDNVQILTVGAEGRAAALASGRIDATMMSAPAYFALEESGFRILANIMDFEDLQWPSALLFRRDNPGVANLAEALAEAHAEAVDRFYADKSFAVQAYLGYDKQGQSGMERVYDQYVRARSFDRLPRVSIKEAAPLAEENCDLNAVIDNSAVDRAVHRALP
jgi:ABC-type nitrate/sulfonate/bicarbonate transport system substrate-binding protein